MRTANKTTIAIEVDRALRDRLKRFAAAEKRKLSAYARLVLEEHVAKKLGRTAA